MTTSILYHVFRIRGYDLARTRFQGGSAQFGIEPQRLRCSGCGSYDVIRRGSRLRSWRHLPVGTMATSLEMSVPRVACQCCQAVRQVEVGFAQPFKSYTKAFARFVLDLYAHMTIDAIARYLKIGWHVIKEIVKADLGRRYADPLRYSPRLRRIAIDEIAVRKGHRYLTIVLDLDRGAVVFVGEGKGADALKPFFDRLGARRCRQIEAVATDLSAAYQLAVRMNLPHATLVCDRFHVVKLLNDKLTELRRDLYREVQDLQKHVLKGVRWLLLKRERNLDDDRNERQRLRAALELNRPLATAYYLKEELDLFWNQPDKHAAKSFLADWIARAEASGIRALRTFARTLAIHRNQMLAWYDHPISTGPLEGINNKIKTLKRQAYGYRDLDFFRLRIYALHEDPLRR